jgi:gliding motility-associated-like protein
VYALPPAPAISVADVCFGDSLFFITEEGYATYEWVETNTQHTTVTSVGYIGHTAAGSYAYRVRVTDGHGCTAAGYSLIYTGAVYARPELALASASSGAAGCAGVAMAEPVLYTLGGSAAGYTVSGLPAGITASLSGNGIAIGGAPAAGEEGIYDYVLATRNPHGCADVSVGGRITVYAPAPPPALYALPEQPVCRGDSVTLVASGIDVRAWRWTRDGQALPDVTGTRYTVGEEGVYAVSVENSNGCRSAASAFPVRVFDRPAMPALTTGGAPAAVCEGERVALSVEAPEAGATYRWYRNGLRLHEASGTRYEASVAGDYSVVAVNAQGCEGEASLRLRVTVGQRPATPEIVITGAPVFCEGGSVALRASSSSDASSFRWFKDSVAIAGATGVVLTVAESGRYSVEALSSAGCASGRSKVVETRRYERPSNVRITGGPGLFCPGDSIRLEAASDGGTTYRWYRNGVLFLSGAAAQVVREAGLYQVEAVGAQGCISARSAGVAVALHAAPATPVIACAGSPFLCAGERATLWATAAGAASFVWKRDGVPAPVGSASTWAATASGAYTVEAIGAGGCPSAESAALTIVVEDYPPPPLVAGDTLLRLTRGAAVNWTVRNADRAFRYRWYKNDRALSEGAALTIAPLRLADGGVYTVRAASALAGCTSESAPVVVEVLDDVGVGNVVTPDGDGVNEYFTIVGLETYAAHEITIVNRYGNEVFRSADYRSDAQGGWRFDKLPNGVYFYRIRLTDTDGATAVKTGYVVLSGN